MTKERIGHYVLVFLFCTVALTVLKRLLPHDIAGILVGIAMTSLFTANSV